MDPAVFLPGQKPRVPENLEVLGDGGKRHVEGLGQFRDGGLAAGQALEDRATGGIGQGRERGVERTR